MKGGWAGNRLFRSRAIGFLASAAALAFFAYAFDLQDLEKITERIDSRFVPLTAFWLLTFNGIFSLRWYTILAGRLTFFQSLYAVFMGIGANMFLPARGGDVLRLAYSHRKGKLPFSMLGGGVFFEKIMDLTTVAILSVTALFLNSSLRSHISLEKLFLIPIAGLLLAGTLLLFLRKHDSIANAVLRLLRRSPLLGRILPASTTEAFEDARPLLRPMNLVLATLLTLLLWFVAYPLAYYLAGRLIGESLPYPHLLVLAVAGAVGVALPAAPSGLGVLHASLISAFLLLGKKSSDGLIYATTLHLFWFLVFGSLGLLLYLRWVISKPQEEVS